MKRCFPFGLVGLFGFASFVSAGCPIYSDSSCVTDGDCGRNQVCSYGGYCTLPGNAGGAPGGSGETCRAPADCSINTTCGADGLCHTGDCFHIASGCVAGYACQRVDFAYQCVPSGTPVEAGTDGAATDSAVDSRSDGGSIPVDASAPDTSFEAAAESGGGDSGGNSGPAACGHPADCAGGETCAADGVCHAGDCAQNPCINGFVCTTAGGALACVRGNPAACGADSDCQGGGASCVDGMCAPNAELCSDQTQCPGSDRCVDGKCVGSCSSDAECTDGFRCQLALGVCTVAATGCSKTSQCGSGQVCVEHACVPRCGAGAQCAAGSVCVDSGCIPAQKVAGTCKTDGVQDTCPSASVCLHHTCYVTCDASDGGTCSGQPRFTVFTVFTVCKTVTTASGPHAVCGSAQNLGSECDPTAGRACSPGKICIDGFCRQ